MKIYNISDIERAYLMDLYLKYPDPSAIAEYNYAIEQLIAKGYTHYSATKTDLLDEPYSLQIISLN